MNFFRFFFASALVAVLLDASAFAETFSDVSVDDENFLAIEYLVSVGTLEGYTDGTFQSTRSINRAEFMKILVSGQGIEPDAAVYQNCFPDVTEDWYAKYVCYGKEQGWISGYEDGLFRPANTVNRAEAVKMVDGAYGVEIPVTLGANDPFTDVSVSDWYAPYIVALVEMGVIDSVSSVYSPAATMDRGETAETIFRIVVAQSNGEGIYTETYRDAFLLDAGLSDLLVSETVFTWEEEYSYGTFESFPSVDTLSLVEQFSINEALDFPEGNTLKMNSVCYDATLGVGYGAGILTHEIALFEDDEVQAYIDTTLEAGDYNLKKVFCDQGVALVGIEDKIVKIDTESRSVVGSITNSGANWHQADIFLNVEEGWFSVPVAGESPHLEIYNLDTLEEIADLDFDQSSLFTRSDGNTLVVERVSTDGTFRVVILNDSFETVSTFSLAMSSTRLDDVAFDAERDNLWVLMNDRVYVFNMDDLSTVLARMDTVDEAHQIEWAGDYVVTLTENGLDEEGLGNFWGGMEVFSAEDPESLYVLEIPHHHTQVAVDSENHMAYVTNNSDDTVARIDLETSGSLFNPTYIQMGYSAEGGVVVEDGSVYIRNRLGGNSLFHWYPESGLIEEHETNWAWPIAIAYDESLGRVFTYDFLNSSVTPWNAMDELEESYDIGLPDGSTDGLGDMVYDHTRQVLYVALPEQNAVVVMDATDGSILKTIELPDYLQGTSKDYEDLGGPAVLTLATYEPTAKLYVYAANGEVLYAYDGLNDFELIETVEFDAPPSGIKDFPYGLFVDPYHELLYVGEQAFDVETLAEYEELPYGNVVAAIDASRGLIWTLGVSGSNDQETLYLLNEAGDLLDQIVLNSDQYVLPRFAYDEVRGKLYVFYMVPAEVWIVEVT